MASGFLKGTLILTIAGFVVKAIGSINWILLSRILGGEGIGIYQMAFPIYLLLLQISSAGVPIAISILTAERLALHDFGGAKSCLLYTSRCSWRANTSGAGNPFTSVAVVITGSASMASEMDCVHSLAPPR